MLTAPCMSWLSSPRTFAQRDLGWPEIHEDVVVVVELRFHLGLGR
jgi:hypothetical protein